MHSKLIVINEKDFYNIPKNKYFQNKLKEYIFSKRGQKNKNFEIISLSILEKLDIKRIEIFEYELKILIKFISKEKYFDAYIEKNKYDFFDFKNFFENFNDVEYGQRTKN